MKRRLLLMALATTMVASTLLVGCGSSDEGGNNSTPTTSVVQGNDDSSVDTTTKVEDTKKEESTSSKKEEAKAYDEKFYERPDFEKEYEERLAELVAAGSASAEKQAKYEYDKHVRKYEFMKYVFEDMTRRFKNKEEVTATEVIEVAGKEVKSFVCDVTKIVPEEDETYISEDKYSKDYTKVYERGVYEEFAGFKAKSTEVNVNKNDNGEIDSFYVELKANKIEGKGSPMWLRALVDINEDGTYSYREITIYYELYDNVYHE